MFPEEVEGVGGAVSEGVTDDQSVIPRHLCQVQETWSREFGRGQAQKPALFRSELVLVDKANYHGLGERDLGAAKLVAKLDIQTLFDENVQLLGGVKPDSLKRLAKGGRVFVVLVFPEPQPLGRRESAILVADPLLRHIAPSVVRILERLLAQGLLLVQVDLNLAQHLLSGNDDPVRDIQEPFVILVSLRKAGPGFVNELMMHLRPRMHQERHELYLQRLASKSGFRDVIL